jgi:hypothetical protein
MKDPPGTQGAQAILLPDGCRSLSSIKIQRSMILPDFSPEVTLLFQGKFDE